MLVPNTIPDKEPLLRVGIVLPEDGFTSIQAIAPRDKDYQIEFTGRRLPVNRAQALFFKLAQNQITFKIGEQEFTTDHEVKIYPIPDVRSLAPREGAIVKNVISGRGFHWKKYIEVTLPGTIIIRRQQNVLLLINELPLEFYLMCVATSEMGAACPPALIEAQTIAARSWMLANVEQKHVALGMDVCNDDCCQRYQGATFLSEQSVAGAMNTFGKVLLWDKKICDARYSKSCGGVMEIFETIWSGKGLPYLQNIADADSNPPEWKKPLSDDQNFADWVNSVPKTFCSPHFIPEKDLKKYLGSVDEAGSYFRWQEVLEQKELTANINRFHPIQAKAIFDLEPLHRGVSGRLNALGVHYIDQDDDLKSIILQSDFAIRQALHKKFLYSSAFTITKEKGADGLPLRFILQGAGWGHGVGLCQIGALGMALHGYTAGQIVQHYYPGSELKKTY